MSSSNPVRRILFPASGARPAVLSTVRRAVAGVWLTASAVTIIVWLLIFILGGPLLYPFWLWSLGAGALLVAALWLAAELQGRAR